MDIWKEVIGSEGKYKVSNTGRVWSNVYNREIGIKPDKSGYHNIGILYNGKHTNIGVHRLVGFHFLDNYNDGDEINHIDGNKSNNMVDNLEWNTHKQNMEHVSDNLLHPKAKYICILDKHDRVINVFNSMNVVNSKYDINIKCIINCCNGISNDTGGLKIRFYDKKNNSYIKTKFDDPNYKYSSSKKQKIICNETGESFNSQMIASRILNIRQSDISNYLRHKRKKSVKGYTFSYL